MKLHPKYPSIISDGVDCAHVRKFTFSLHKHLIPGPEVDPFLRTNRALRIKWLTHWATLKQKRQTTGLSQR